MDHGGRVTEAVAGFEIWTRCSMNNNLKQRRKMKKRKTIIETLGAGKTGTDNPIIPHPASFPPQIINSIRPRLHRLVDTDEVGVRLLDPFVGIGGVEALGLPWEYHGVEIEQEWGVQAEARGISVHHGDARDLPWSDEYFGVICTSPAYGNRMADAYAPDLSNPKHRKRTSYRIFLGRPLTEGNGGAIHWGEAYRELHVAIWRESVRVLKPGGVFILNCKDHSRKKEIRPVTAWHVGVLVNLGLEPLEASPIWLRGNQNTATMRKRGIQVVDNEWVIALRKPTVPKPISEFDAEAWLARRLGEQTTGS